MNAFQTKTATITAFGGSGLMGLNICMVKQHRRRIGLPQGGPKWGQKLFKVIQGGNYVISFSASPLD